VAYDAILFDFDGTLVDSEPVHYECWQEVLEPFGLSMSWEEYCQYCIGVSDRAMIERMAKIAGLDFETLYAQYPKKKQMLRDRMVADPPMDERVREFLLEFERLPMGLVTSSYRNEVEPVLEKLKIKSCFKAAIYGDEVTKLKPHPEPYWTAAAQLGAKEPLVFEDSEAGYLSASTAGFVVIQVLDPEDLPDLLRHVLDGD
jgi:beta-phosphoglucomutase